MWEHSIGNLAIANATTTVGGLWVNSIRMCVVFGARKREINGMKSLVAFLHLSLSSLGSKGSLPVRSCSVKRTSEVTGFLEVSTSSTRNPLAYFRKRLHSAFVGILVKDFAGRVIRQRFSNYHRRTHKVTRLHPPNIPR